MDNEQIQHCLPSLKMNIKTIRVTDGLPLRGMHFHKELELVRVDQGQIQCRINDTRFLLSQSQILLIGSKAMHQLSSCGTDARCTYIQADISEYLLETMPQSRDFLCQFVNSGSLCSHTVCSTDSELGDIFAHLQKESRNQICSFHIAVKAYLFLLITFMSRNNMLFDSASLENNKTLSRLLPAIDYIEANYHSKITLEDVCTLIHMDKYNFCKLFRQATGATFVEYLNFRRLSCAEHLLLHSDQSITAIALDSGFMSIQYFNKVFKKYKGCLPTAYRKHYAQITFDP